MTAPSGSRRILEAVASSSSLVVQTSVASGDGIPACHEAHEQLVALDQTVELVGTVLLKGEEGHDIGVNEQRAGRDLLGPHSSARNARRAALFCGVSCTA